jgi:hypothetical protein
MKKVGMLIVVIGWIAAIILCLRPELALRLRMWLRAKSPDKAPGVQNHRKGNIILLSGGKDAQEEESLPQDVEEAEEISQGDPRSGPDPPFQ